MSIESSAEIVRFQSFISEHVGRGENLSPEEALDLWRAANPHPGEAAATVAALGEACSPDMQSGDGGVPLEEFDRAFRLRHGLVTP